MAVLLVSLSSFDTLIIGFDVSGMDEGSLIDFFIVYRSATEIYGDVVVPESRLVGLSRRLGLSFRRDRDIYTTAKHFRNIIRIVFRKQGRFYVLRQRHWLEMLDLTSRIIDFSPISLRIVKGRNLVDGFVVKLRGVMSVGGLKYVRDLLFQTTLVGLEGDVRQYVGHIRCLWKQCRLFGEEVNFADCLSMRRSLMYPHIKYLIRYLLAKIDSIPIKLRPLSEFIISHADMFFGDENVSLVDQDIIKLSMPGWCIAICLKCLSAECSHIGMLREKKVGSSVARR